MSKYSQYHLFEVSQPAEYVLHVEINRPKVLNAMNEATWTQYRQILQQAELDSDVRVIVLSGKGRAFCSGLDIKGASGEFSQFPEEQSRKALALHKHIRNFQDAIHQAHVMNKPVIGVAHGVAIGLALDILSAVDIRYASKDAKLSVREIAIGMAADIGSLQRLPKIVNNIGWLKEVSYTGRFFTPEEAKSQGLINEVFETKEKALDKALELAKDIAEKSPVAVHGTKKSINFAIDHNIADGLEQIAEFNAHALGEDFFQGIMAAMSKDKPKYSKL